MNTQKTETHINQRDFVCLVPAWLRVKQVMIILNCEKSMAHKIIKKINEYGGHDYVVGSQVHIDVFIEYYEGKYTKEMIRTCLEHSAQLERISTQSAKSTQEDLS